MLEIEDFGSVDQVSSFLLRAADVFYKNENSKGIKNVFSVHADHFLLMDKNIADALWLWKQCNEPASLFHYFKATRTKIFGIC